MATWVRISSQTVALGLNFLGDTPSHPQYVRVVFPSQNDRTVKPYGILTIGSREDMPGVGSYRETPFQEQSIWYPSQMIEVIAGQECQFAYLYTNTHSFSPGKVVELWGFQ